MLPSDTTLKNSIQRETLWSMQQQYPIPETPNDELDLPPRHRWRNYQAAQTAIQTISAAHPEVFRLDTYGLRNRYISNRLIEAHSQDMGTIMRSIAATWADYALQEHMNVYHVPPQPVSPPATITLIIEFPTQEWDFMISRAVLIDSFVDNVPAGRQAEYIDAQGPARGVALATGYRPRCRPSGVDHCLVGSRGNSYLLHEEIWADHGDYTSYSTWNLLRRSIRMFWRTFRLHVHSQRIFGGAATITISQALHCTSTVLLGMTA